MFRLKAQLSKNEKVVGISATTKGENMVITVSAYYESQLHELLLTALRIFGVPKSSFALFRNGRTLEVKPTQTAVKIIINDGDGNSFTLKQKMHHEWEVYYLAELLRNEYAQCLLNALAEDIILNCVNEVENILMEAVRDTFDIADALTMELTG